MLPNILCEVVKYPDLNRVCNVFNKNTIDDYFWLHLPCETTKMEFHKLFNISGQNKIEIDTTDKLGRENDHPWIRINSSILDTTVGKKLYKIQLMDVQTDEPYNYYFTYIIQDDNPYTPYVYMEGRGNHTNPNKAESEN